MMRERPVLLTMLFVLFGAFVVSAPAAADRPVVSVAAGALLGPLARDASVDVGPGGRVAFGLPLGSLPLRASAGAGLYRVAAPDEASGAATLALPEIGIVYAPSVSMGALDVDLTVGPLYRHYIAWQQAGGREYVSYRPVGSLIVGAHAVLGERLEVGPVVMYSVFFERELRHVLEPQIELRLSL